MHISWLGAHIEQWHHRETSGVGRQAPPVSRAVPRECDSHCLPSPCRIKWKVMPQADVRIYLLLHLYTIIQTARMGRGVLHQFLQISQMRTSKHSCTPCVCSEFKAKNKSHTFFEKVENSWKFSPYVPPYKLVMQTKVGSQELRPAGICLGDSASKTGCSGCWLGTVGCIAGSPSPGPSF